MFDFGLLGFLNDFLSRMFCLHLSCFDATIMY